MAARLLIVDDEEINLEILSSVLEDDYEIVRAMNGVETLEALKKQPDMVLLDVHLPDMDGYQLIQKIHEVDERIPVIFITASTDSNGEAKGLELGAVDYITKPFNPTTVKFRIRNQLIMRDINNNMLGMVIENSPSYLAFKDLNGIYRMTNENFCAMLGLPSERVYGSDDRQIFPEELAEKYRREDREVLELGETRTYEYWADNVTDGTRIFLSVQKSPVYSHDMRQMGVLVVGSDLTQRVKAQEEKEKLQEQLSQSQKIEAIGRLTGGIAHDINNMMAGITTYASLGARALPADHKVTKYFHNILDTAGKLTKMNRQLLDFSRKGSVLPTRLDLNAEVESALSLFRMMAKRNITLQFRPGDNIPEVFIDPVQLDQVIANFLSNAVDAIGVDNNGSITLSTFRINRGAVTRPQNLPQGNFAALTIRDSGCGISPENLKKIFEPFFTTKGVGKGTGLGLPSIFGIIQQNHGHMTVQSTVGVGTLFTVYLPEYQSQGDVSAKQGGASRGTVLLVHSRSEILTPAMEALNGQDYLVLAANTPERVARIIEDHDGKIDLLVLDMTMAGINAIDLIEQLRQMHKDMKALLVTNFADQLEYLRKELPYPVQLVKPFVAADFLAAVQKARE